MALGVGMRFAQLMGVDCGFPGQLAGPPQFRYDLPFTRADLLANGAGGSMEISDGWKRGAVG